MVHFFKKKTIDAADVDLDRHRVLVDLASPLRRGPDFAVREVAEQREPHARELILVRPLRIPHEVCHVGPAQGKIRCNQCDQMVRLCLIFGQLHQ